MISVVLAHGREGLSSVSLLVSVDGTDCGASGKSSKSSSEYRSVSSRSSRTESSGTLPQAFFLSLGQLIVPGRRHGCVAVLEQWSASPHACARLRATRSHLATSLSGS